MQVIFSRKGFDSGSGGCPSPIFDDGSMISLPIPDSASRIRFGDLAWRGRNLGEIVEQLTRARIGGADAAHLDPDLRPELLRRPQGWRPLLGQSGTAQRHLTRRRVGRRDVFLFFGLFRRVNARLRWTGPRMHVVWGWMQVSEVVPVDAVARPGLEGPWAWTASHPHLAHAPDPDNTLYVAKRGMTIPDDDTRSLPGAGTFDTFHPRLQLTAEGESVSRWSVPRWLLPVDRPPLSFHGKKDRWKLAGDRVRLQTVGRGQEFVLDATVYPEALPWIAGLIRDLGA